MKKQSKYLRMFLYVCVTALITFVTLIDSFTNEQIEVFTAFDWSKLIFKAFIPSLVSIKAYLDNTVSEYTKLPPSIITTPVNTQSSCEGTKTDVVSTSTKTRTRKKMPRAI